MNVVMFGTGDFALPTFLRLIGSEHRVMGLVTQPDRPQGRKQELIPSRIKSAAVERSISVFQPEDVNTAESIATIRDWGADLFVTAAYGQILSADLLSVPALGGVNLHGSILPKYRGAAPVARAIQNGESETGVTVIHMTPKIDAGGMIRFARSPIGPDDTAGEVEARISELGAPLILEVIADLAEGKATALPQTKARVTRAPKLSKSDSPIDWSRPALAIHNLVRAMQPWPACETYWHPVVAGKPPVRLIVHKTAVANGQGEPGTVLTAEGDRLEVAAGESSVRLLLIQAPGKKPMAAADFLRGNFVQRGDLMGPPSP